MRATTEKSKVGQRGLKWKVPEFGNSFQVTLRSVKRRPKLDNFGTINTKKPVKVAPYTCQEQFGVTAAQTYSGNFLSSFLFFNRTYSGNGPPISGVT